MNRVFPKIGIDANRNRVEEADIVEGTFLVMFHHVFGLSVDSSPVEWQTAFRLNIN
jgi:hypothetical protein